MFLKSVLQVGPSPRTAPPPSLHASLAVKLQPQNLATREPQTSAKVLNSPGKLERVLLAPFPTLAFCLSSCQGKSPGRGQVWQGEKGACWSGARYGRRRWEDLPFPLLAPVTKALLEMPLKTPPSIFSPMYPGIQLNSPLNLLSSFCQSTGKIGRTRPLKAQPWKYQVSGDRRHSVRLSFTISASRASFSCRRLA